MHTRTRTGARQSPPGEGGCHARPTEQNWRKVLEGHRGAQVAQGTLDVTRPLTHCPLGFSETGLRNSGRLEEALGKIRPVEVQHLEDNEDPNGGERADQYLPPNRRSRRQELAHVTPATSGAEGAGRTLCPLRLHRLRVAPQLVLTSGPSISRGSARRADWEGLLAPEPDAPPAGTPRRRCCLWRTADSKRTFVGFPVPARSGYRAVPVG